MKTLPVVKCTVSTDEKEVDVSRLIDEYDMLETVLKRDNTSGVLATVTFPVNFVSYAKDYVKSLFEKDGLYTRARFNVYLREDRGVNYNLVKSTALDFSSYKEETERVTVECAEEELTQLINSEGKTKYEILVDNVNDENGNIVEEGVGERKQWDYQRMELLNGAVYTIPTDQDFLKNVDEGAYYIRPNMLLSNSEIAPGTLAHNIKEQQWGYGGEHREVDDYFIEIAETTSGIMIDIDLDFHMGLKDAFISEPLPILAIMEKYEMAHGTIRGTIDTWTTSIEYSVADAESRLFAKVSTKRMIPSLLKGTKLAFCLITRGKLNKLNYIKCTRFGKFEVTYRAKSKNVAKINVVDPIKLMQKYLNEMSGKDNYFSVEIQWKEKDYKTMIVAAESIRQISGAKVYGSPNDFFDWMKVLGYEYECIDRKLIFKPRDEFFKKNVSAMGLRAHELADLIVQADKTYAYTSIEIGYDKQDYDSINGRCEANGMFCYTTGFIGTKDNKLKLISPYRVDSLGIELLCRETDRNNRTDVNKGTTDTKSDNDVFFVALNDNGDSYTEYKGIEIVDKELGIKMFNAPFNPYFLIQRNESLIGINAKQVKFKSTDMSRTADITNVTKDKGIYSDQQITKKLFEPIEYNFAAGHWQKIPVLEKRNGLIYFEWQGEILKGFIKEIRKNYACETETTWILWAVK